MKKKVFIVLAAILIAAGAGTGIWYRLQKGSQAGSSDTEAVFVDNVGMITGLSGTNGLFSRYSGVVEPQKTEKIELASGLKVKENYVSVGDEVEVGTKLFSYDTDDAQDSITQLEIDIENYEISIKSSKSQAAQLEKERAKVSDDEKLSYTTQIMTIENSIKKYEYEMKSKQAEMESLKRQIANADVTSPIQGIIKTISSNTGGDDSSALSGMDSGEDSSAYMTIMATGEYRIKGKINEQNMMEIQEGVEMLAYSRVDESLIWRGTITSIDRESSSSNSNSYYGDSGDSSLTSSSSYPFYVELESSDGLMLGQHVYLMVDNGQEEEEDGLWLEDYYFITDEDGTVTNCVWAADKNDRLEKREVSLGNYNEETFKYQILDGLTVDDYIAFPDYDCVEGAPVTKNTADFDDSADEFGADLGADDWGEDDWSEDGDDGWIDESGLMDALDGGYEDAGSGEEVYE